MNCPASARTTITGMPMWSRSSLRWEIVAAEVDLRLHDILQLRLDQAGVEDREVPAGDRAAPPRARDGWRSTSPGG